ncbi:nicotinate-nucleotide--dimethylbenzimidazole phosphoribosyltransferase [Alkalicoccus daliensis]|uniref:Nicotinate-nucleotide--dimethylbenzimidazole phosphoribosyltransferase n=1 Tax=Alkalicoccus daliensis TaxID=745820 RepID=A0A1H0HZ93_9BACI|nr:nicotinate-nucleotide--dimethylbenzimidazole phosphoribosyltransferase [Alkalicoccus daliensis]SDO24141.1 nicotinate-nucleotide-dimethylbenzimidazole phosphoribosyltransferase [Alkalicoccus daliensis]
MWQETVNQITSKNEQAEKEMGQYLNTLTKPLGSLGRLEKLAVQLAGIQSDIDVSSPAVLVFAGDHKVTDEGVSLYGSEVTQLMVHNFVKEGAAINVLARQIGASVTVVDVGVDSEALEGAVARKIKRGSGNIAIESAMTLAAAEEAIATGIEMAQEAVSKGAKIIIPGEMGIGNTTPSSALLAKWTGELPEAVTGSGTGVEGEQLLLKAEVIRKAVNRSEAVSPLEVLADIGGLEIAALTGAMLGAAEKKTPVLIDGFIATVAALGAVKLAPAAGDYFIFGHRSAEAGHEIALRALKADPLLDLQMRLGEGTGAAAAYPLVAMAAGIVKEMATFADLGMDV